jgi:hypothetical protein
MAGIGALDRQVVKILDASGALLTAAMAGALDEEHTLTLTEVDDHGALIDYFFGRCERIVIVEHESVALEGTLDTRWLSSERRWWIGLSQATTARAPTLGGEAEPAHAYEAVSAHEGALTPEPVPNDARLPAVLLGGYSGLRRAVGEQTAPISRSITGRSATIDVSRGSRRPNDE